MEHTVEAVMTSQVVTARPTTPFHELVRLLEQHHVSALPVIDDTGRLVGIVSEADQLMKEGYPHGAEDAGVVDAVRHRHRLGKAAGTRAAELMAAPVITVPLGTSIADAVRLMFRLDVKHLPVMDARGRLAGIVTAAICSRCSCDPTRRSAGRSTTTSSAGSSASPPARSRSKSATGSSACVARWSATVRVRRWSGACRPWMVWSRSTPGSPGASTTR